MRVCVEIFSVRFDRSIAVGTSLFVCFFLRSRVFFPMTIEGHVPLRIAKKRMSGSTWHHHQGNCSCGTWTSSVTKKNDLDRLGIGDYDIVLFAYLFVGRLDFPLGPYPKRERESQKETLHTKVRFP